MSVKMRIIQIFDPAHEQEFLRLEAQFAKLEQQRTDFPQGTRYKPIASALPSHTLIWEASFASLAEAHAALQFMNQDDKHEDLAQQQRRFFTEIRVEFLESLGAG